jgi:competence protein ComEC
VREELETIAQRHGVKVKTVTRETLCALGEAMVTIYPPVGAGDMNEQGLTVLATAEDFDVLITGDMKDSTERKLVEQYPLPDVEVLLVGHHGSKYSSHEDFLAAVKPEIAIISVGDNSYGHPTAEAIGRLEAVGAVVRRTDEEGDITIYGGEEDGR